MSHAMANALQDSDLYLHRAVGSDLKSAGMQFASPALADRVFESLRCKGLDTVASLLMISKNIRGFSSIVNLEMHTGIHAAIF